MLPPMLRRPAIHAFSYPCVLSSRKDSVCRIVGLHSGKCPPALQVGSTHLAFGPAPLLKASGGTDGEAPADDIIGCTISGTHPGPNRRRFVRDIGHTGTQRELFVYVDAREEVHIGDRLDPLECEWRVHVMGIAHFADVSGASDYLKSIPRERKRTYTLQVLMRSDKRREGKERVRTCRSRVEATNQIK